MSKLQTELTEEEQLKVLYAELGTLYFAYTNIKTQEEEIENRIQYILNEIKNFKDGQD